MISFQLQCCCVTLPTVSCMLVRLFQMLFTLNLPSLQQNRRRATQLASLVSCVVWEVWDFNWRGRALFARLTRGSNTSITLSHNVVISFLLQRCSATLTMVSYIDTHIWSPNIYNNQMLATSATKSASWNRLCLHSFAFVSNMTTFPRMRRACGIKYQSRQLFVASSGPVCDSSRHSETLDIKSTDLCAKSQWRSTHVSTCHSMS